MASSLFILASLAFLVLGYFFMGEVLERCSHGGARDDVSKLRRGWLERRWMGGDRRAKDLTGLYVGPEKRRTDRRVRK